MILSPIPMMKSPSNRPSTRKKKPRLSLCMIVKDEARTLEKCLSLARPHVDEIVVVDTGSTDGTQAIARRYTDVFDEIPWPGSFSEARNYSLELASGAFALILDGDEYIADPSHWKRLRNALRQPNLAAIELPILNLLREDGLVAADRFWQPRVLHNHPGLRYEGKVHNQIGGSISTYMAQTGRRQIQVRAEVTHTGYALSQERLTEKYAPRLPLLIWEYRNARTPVLQAYYGYQLGVAYIALDQLDEAAGVFNELDYDRLAPQNAFYTHVLAAQTAVKLRRAPRALLHSNRALALSRTEPMGYYVTGLSLMLMKQTSDGLLMMLEALNVNEAGHARVRFVMNARQLLRQLATIFERAGMQNHALAFRKLCEQEVYDAQAVRTFVEALKGRLIQAERAAQPS